MMPNQLTNWCWTLALAAVVSGCTLAPNAPTPVDTDSFTAPATPASADLAPPSASVLAPLPVAAPETGDGRCTVEGGRADRLCTPGVFNPEVTQDSIRTTICVSGWTTTVRPPTSYTTPLKTNQKVTYGLGDMPNSELEEDHLVPLELGGSPRDPLNLWPEPRAGIRGAHAKNVQANALHAAVCNGTRTLDEARAEMISDWTHP